MENGQKKYSVISSVVLYYNRHMFQADSMHPCRCFAGAIFFSQTWNEPLTLQDVAIRLRQTVRLKRAKINE